MRSNATGPIHILAVIAALATICALSLGAQSMKSAKMPAASAGQSGVKLQPLNVKTGLWQTTSTLKVSGEMPIPAGTLDKLTPEQRARLEDRMKANPGAHTSTDTSKACVTAESLKKMDFGQGKPGCTYTIETSTSTEAKGRYSCEDEGGKVTGEIEAQAPDQEHVKGSTHGVVNGGGHTMTVDTTFTSKWVSASCGDMK